MSSKPTILALDLGSTNIKLAQFNPLTNEQNITSHSAPKYKMSGQHYEAQASEFLAITNALINTHTNRATQYQLRLATQRSSFVLWDKKSGKELTPLISWQDTRGQAWCKQTNQQDEIERKTGLKLSAHYIAPKLATLFKEDKVLAQLAKKDKLLFGTLDTYCIWHWTNKRHHITDISMAARSLLVELDSFSWSESLLNQFSLPPEILPQITSSTGLSIACQSNIELSSLLADQSAASIPWLKEADTLLINLGTGGFILKALNPGEKANKNYLTTTLYGKNNNKTLAQEATINGIGPALTEIDKSSFSPKHEVFCIPDITGLGAPYWQPNIKLTFSKENLKSSEKYQAIVEGITFRISDILKQWYPTSQLPKIVLTGGLVEHHPQLAQALSDTLQHPISVPKNSETTLIGLISLTEKTELKTSIIEPDSDSSLPTKLKSWGVWFKNQLNQN